MKKMFEYLFFGRQFSTRRTFIDHSINGVWLDISGFSMRCVETRATQVVEAREGGDIVDLLAAFGALDQGWDFVVGDVFR